MWRGLVLTMVGVNGRVRCCSFDASRVLRCSSDGKTLMAGKRKATSFRWCAKKARRIRTVNNVTENRSHELNVGMVVVVSVSEFGDGRLLLHLFFCLTLSLYVWSISDCTIEMGRETQHEERGIEEKSWPTIRDDSHLLVVWFTKVGQGFIKHFLNEIDGYILFDFFKYFKKNWSGNHNYIYNIYMISYNIRIYYKVVRNTLLIVEKHMSGSLEGK